MSAHHQTEKADWQQGDGLDWNAGIAVLALSSRPPVESEAVAKIHRQIHYEKYCHEDVAPENQYPAERRIHLQIASILHAKC